MSEAPHIELDRFGDMPPALREWRQFVDDYADFPAESWMVMAHVLYLVHETGAPRFLRKHLPVRALKAAGCGRVCLPHCLNEFADAGFLSREGEGAAAVYTVREDIAREIACLRAGKRREGLRVIKGGKARD